MGYQVFPIPWREPLPCIPVPLRGEYPDVPLDLQFVMNRGYERGPYRRGAVNFSQPPSTPVLQADEGCAGELLQRAQVTSH